MSGNRPLLEIGRITKPHGLRGELLVVLSTNRTDRLCTGLVVHTPDGPLTVTAARAHQDRWIVRFDGINDRTAAEAVRGLVLRAEPLDDPDELWIHELIGASVLDGDGSVRGVVEAVEANPASDLLVLDTEVLVPLTFVTEISDGRVIIDAPPGLFELNEA